MGIRIRMVVVRVLLASFLMLSVVVAFGPPLRSFGRATATATATSSWLSTKSDHYRHNLHRHPFHHRHGAFMSKVEPDIQQDTLQSLSSSSSSLASSLSSVVLAEDVEFVKPIRDTRKYRYVRLSNGLQVLLVQASDNDDVEAGGLHVHAGHFDDVNSFPGLAHFHEHMLFLGTTKYPSPDEYESYLSTHGGSSNAYTDMEDTNYYFSVTPGDDDNDTTTTTTTTNNNNNNEEEEDDDDESVSSALRGALDRFAQFFIAPTFDESMVEREIKAIDSEYRNSITSDAWRMYQLLKYTSNPAHPFSKFGCGNAQTLLHSTTATTATTTTANDDDDDDDDRRTGLIDELWNFWKTYYRTSNMKLCVVGKASLNALQQCVEETFGTLKASNIDDLPRRGKTHSNPRSIFATEHAQYSSNDNMIMAFGPEQLGMVRETIPLMESRVLKIYFATPPLDDPVLRDSKPFRVFSHILGHESPGSLHSLFNIKGWVTDLSCGIGIDTSDFSLFSLSMSLTPEGMKNKDKVLDLVFQWIALLKKAPDETLRLYHDEIRQISSTNFLYRENGDPQDFASTAAELLFEFGENPEQLLVGSSYTGEYDPMVGHAFLDRLRPDNALIAVINSDFSLADGEWEKEPWYGANYRNVPISPQQVQEWANPPEIDPRLHLPGLNQYIPTDFSLRCEDLPQSAQAETNGDNLEELELEPPSLLIHRPNLRMWHKLDRYWRVPKTFIRLSLLSPNVYRSPRTMTLNRLFQRVLQDDLNSFVYDASVAGCNYRVVSVPTGYRVSIRGYSEKLPFLLDTLTTRMLSLIHEMKSGDAHPSLQRKFEKAIDNLLRETKNYRLDTPYEIANYNARLVTEESVWYVTNYIDEMEGPQAEKRPLTMDECARVAEECLRGRVKAEALCIGNIDESDANKVVKVIDSHFLNASTTLSDVETPTFRSMKLPTRDEAISIFGPEADQSVPLVYHDLAYSESEENNAVELVLQVGCELGLGYEGVAILDLISHMAYNSAFTQLRTVEQLGYIVSCSARKMAGSSWALSTVVQSSVAEPAKLEERIEAWLVQFRKELEEMDPTAIAKEASACVAQLLERDTQLSQEVGRVWVEITETETLSDALKEPAFDRLDRLADELIVVDDTDNIKDDDDDEEGEEVHANGVNKHGQTAAQLKQKVLDFFDTHLAATASQRRAMSSRVYSQKFKTAHDADVGKPGVLSNYGDIFHLKQFLSTWPTVPYFIKQDTTTTIDKS